MFASNSANNTAQFSTQDINDIIQLLTIRGVFPDETTADPATRPVQQVSDEAKLISGLQALEFPDLYPVENQENSLQLPGDLYQSAYTTMGDEDEQDEVKEAKGEDLEVGLLVSDTELAAGSASSLEHEIILKEAKDKATEMWGNRHWLAIVLKNLLLAAIVSELFFAYFFYDELYPVFKVAFDFCQFGDIASTLIAGTLAIYFAYGINLPLDIISEKPKEMTIEAIQAMLVVKNYFSKGFNHWTTEGWDSAKGLVLRASLGLVSSVAFLLMGTFFSMGDYRQVDESANSFVPRLILYAMIVFPSMGKLYNAYHRPVDNVNKSGVPFWTVFTLASMLFFSLVEYGFQESNALYQLDVQSWLTTPYCIVITLVTIAAYFWQFLDTIEQPINFGNNLVGYLEAFSKNPINNITFGFDAFVKAMLQLLGRGATGAEITKGDGPTIGFFTKDQLQAMSWVAFAACGYVGLCTSVSNAAPFPHVLSGTKANEWYNFYLEGIARFAQNIPASQKSFVNGAYHIIQLVCLPIIGYCATQAGMILSGSDAHLYNSPLPWIVSALLLLNQMHVTYHTLYKAAGFGDARQCVKDMTALKKAMLAADNSRRVVTGIKDVEDESVFDSGSQIDNLLADSSGNQPRTPQDKIKDAYKKAMELEEALSVVLGKTGDLEGELQIIEEARDLIEATYTEADEASHQHGIEDRPTIVEKMTWGVEALPFQREMIARDLLQAIFFYKFLSSFLKGHDEVLYPLVIAASVLYAFNRYVNYRRTFEKTATPFYNDTFKPKIKPVFDNAISWFKGCVTVEGTANNDVELSVSNSQPHQFGDMSDITTAYTPQLND